MISDILTVSREFMDEFAISHEVRRPITKIVIEEITKWITSGKYKPGDALPSENELAKIFNVSKPSIRESLKSLVAFGAIEINHGRPPTVCLMNSVPLVNFFHLAVTAESGGMKEAIELRRGLEIQSTLIAAQRATKEDISVLGGIIDQLNANKAHTELWVPCHVEFHNALAKATHNRFYTFLQEALRETIDKTNRMIIAAQPKRDPEIAFQRHLAIFEAVKAHDQKLARRAIEEHFNAVDLVVETQMKT